MTVENESSNLSEDDPYAETDFQNAVYTNGKRRIYRRKPKTADNLISQIISRRGIAAEKSNNQLNSLWQSMVSVTIANQTKVGTVRRGILEITVSNSTLLQNLGFGKADYLEQLNQQMQNQTIKDIRFRIGSVN